MYPHVLMSHVISMKIASLPLITAQFLLMEKKYKFVRCATVARQIAGVIMSALLMPPFTPPQLASVNFKLVSTIR